MEASEEPKAEAISVEVGIENIIDQLYVSGNALIDYLRNNREITLLTEAETSFKKSLLLSAASYFESQISDTVLEFVKSRTQDQLVFSLIKAKAVNRQYHTYFSWDNAKKANSFFSMFGDEFKLQMEAKVKAEQKLYESVKSFLSLGTERNKLVHQNFAEVVIDKTAEEIYKLFQQGLYFVKTVRRELVVEQQEGA